MSMLVYLIPVALSLGGLALLSFLWALRDGQYDDLDGAAERILLDDHQRFRDGWAPAEHPDRGFNS